LKVSTNVEIAMQYFENFGGANDHPRLRAWLRPSHFRTACVSYVSACSQFSVSIGGWCFAGKLTHMVTNARVLCAQANQ